MPWYGNRHILLDLCNKLRVNKSEIYQTGSKEIRTDKTFAIQEIIHKLLFHNKKFLQRHTFLSSIKMPKPSNSTLHKMFATFSLAAYAGVGLDAAVTLWEVKNIVVRKVQDKEEK